ncbi:MAG: MBL fold metallo-hydrolase [Schleiferiaceae bacterium]|nr:MBL fold metallo-hydrolase [Schleiferiaceae bacterium]
MTPIELEFLGTGTSGGVPLIGCDCPVCTSSDLHNHRLRSSVLIRCSKTSVVIDCGPDFRQQMLRCSQRTLDAIVLTHEHMDHVAGLDEVRPLNYQQKVDMPIFCTDRVANRLKQQFSYAFGADKYPGAPGLRLETIYPNQSFKVAGVEWIPILGQHGTWPVMGFRIADLVYLTDVSAMAEDQVALIRGAKVLVLNALRKTSHVSHFSLDEAKAFAQECAVPEVYFTHISHQMGDHAEVENSLPSHMHLAYDQLRLTIQ